MRQRHLGALLWVFLLFSIGTVRFLWAVLRTVAWMRFRSLVALGGLLVVLSTSNLVTVQLSDGVWPLGHVILSFGLPALGAVVLFHGIRSPLTWQLWRALGLGQPSRRTDGPGRVQREWETGVAYPLVRRP